MQPPIPSDLKRISLRTIGEYILEELSLERGLGYTFRELLLRPREVIWDYLFVERRKMVKPIPLLLLTAGLTTLLSFHFLDLGSELSANQAPDELPPEIWNAISRVLPFVQQYFNLALISILPVQALATFIIFREQKLYYAEHLVINIYLNCLQSLFIIVAIPLITIYPTAGTILALLSSLYFYYAITKIFEQSWWHGFWKTLLVFLLGQFFYSVILALVIVILANL